MRDAESDYADTLNVTLLRPLSHAFLFEPVGEARNVSSLDEVPDSSWFTNRTVAPADLDRGPCPDSGPVPPLVIKSSKGAGVTPGFVVKDARDFAQERDGLLEVLTLMSRAGPSGITKDPHPFFGKLTPAEWDTLQWKHVDHHLRQFGA